MSSKALMDSMVYASGCSLKMVQLAAYVWWTEQDENWQVKPASRGARLAVVQWWSTGTPVGNDFLRSA